MVVRPHIWHGEPSSKLAIPPQLPEIGLFLKITPMAIAVNENAIKRKIDINSIIVSPFV